MRQAFRQSVFLACQELRQAATTLVSSGQARRRGVASSISQKIESGVPASVRDRCGAASRLELAFGPYPGFRQCSTSAAVSSKASVPQSSPLHCPGTGPAPLPPVRTPPDLGKTAPATAAAEKPRLVDAQDTGSKEYYVMAKSFLLGSTIDLERLRPRFEDVLRAHGKDYLVMAVTPRDSVHAYSRANQPSAHLPPEHTYFVVFRFGAVVLFQGFPSTGAGGRQPPQVSAPSEAVNVAGGFDNPWEATPETWRQAATFDEGELIFLLLRPFIRESSDGILFGAEFDLSSLPEAETVRRSSFSRPVLGAVEKGPLMYKESVQLVVRPWQQKFIMQEPDLFAIRELDVGTLRCVAAALGQSSALDFYSSKVDTVLAQANTVNLAMARAGVFPAEVLGSNFLQRMIGYSSLIHSAVISQIGLMDKNDLAWQYDKYDNMLELLRAEFDLEKRLKNLEAKISVVADNANCFLGIQQHQKSNFLEWLIVALIAAEICVSLVEMYTHNVPSLLWRKLTGKGEEAPLPSA